MASKTEPPQSPIRLDFSAMKLLRQNALVPGSSPGGPTILKPLIFEVSGFFVAHDCIGIDNVLNLVASV